MQAAPAAVAARPAGQLTPGQVAPGQGEEVDNADGPPSSPPMSGEKLVAALAGRTRGRNPAMGTDEWTRQRKDNHKEVERRRRGNINEGINELGRIVPNGSGEKAKGAILARAVQYIHHLKDNEARNIEKWTLEKLLMDQAMGDLQAQLEEVKRLWEEERAARSRAETELEMLRGLHGVTGATKAPAASGEASAAENSNKRRSEDLAEGEGGERSDKKARTE
ncbi:hypothetical protein BDN72DRAFT_334640 [Pluteus cervinus]|uniref:Uncharacterized protein n=1 Tax=Pluteus cervinus TaxID=181527 RepID=A0ACD3B2V4_9AGAR|nr:hypothetical protein BDN72DRAFT_334640 [Pluteus cervinus]